MGDGAQQTLSVRMSREMHGWLIRKSANMMIERGKRVSVNALVVAILEWAKGVDEQGKLSLRL